MTMVMVIRGHARSKRRTKWFGPPFGPWLLVKGVHNSSHVCRAYINLDIY